MMKNLLLAGLLFFLLGLSSLYGQKVSIDELLDKNVEYSGVVLEDGEVHGYLFIYSIDKPQKDEVRMEYRYYDRNLNPVFNGRFNTYKGGKFEQATIMNNSLLVTRKYQFLTYEFHTFVLLSVDEESQIREMVLQQNKLVPFKYEERKKVIGTSTESHIKNYLVIRSGESHFILAFANHQTGILNTEFNIFNHKFESIFKFEVPAKNKAPYSFLMIQGLTKGYLVFTESFMKNPTQLIKRDLLIFSLDSLRLSARHTLEEKGTPFVHQLRFRELEGKLYQSALYSKYNNSEYYNMKKPLGIYLKIFDSSGKKIHEKYIIWKELGKKMDLSKSGKYVLSKDRPYMSDFQPLSPNRIFYIITRTTQGSIPIGSAAQTKHSIQPFNYERYDRDIQHYGLIVSDELKWADDKMIDNFKKWDTSFDLYFTQRLDGGKRFFFTMHEYYEFVSLVSKQENGFFFYMVDKDGIKSTSKFVEKKDNIVISPIRAKSGYILIEEKDTKKKTYYLRLEKMDF